MGEHNFYFVHGDNLYDELLKVPLVISYKDIAKNKTINNLVQSIDITPTILDVAGIKIPKEFEGVSLVPLIQKGEYRVKHSFSEIEKIKCVRIKNWKLIYNIDKNKYELYNLKDDPKELKNLVNIEKEKLKFLNNELHKWLKKTKLNIVEQKQSLDEETKRSLRSLGYIQ
jgi:arylsulfatase A-like enzyme